MTLFQIKNQQEEKKMQIINMKLSEIHPYEKNPRFNDGAVEAVANSIKEFGFQQPIVVDKDLVVVVGHTRLKAAEQLGLTEVPMVIAENLRQGYKNIGAAGSVQVRDLLRSS